MKDNFMNYNNYILLLLINTMDLLIDFQNIFDQQKEHLDELL